MTCSMKKFHPSCANSSWFCAWNLMSWLFECDINKKSSRCLWSFFSSPPQRRFEQVSAVADRSSIRIKFWINSLPILDFKYFSLFIASALEEKNSTWITVQGLNFTVYPLVTKTFCDLKRSVRLDVNPL